MGRQALILFSVHFIFLAIDIVNCDVESRVIRFPSELLKYTQRYPFDHDLSKNGHKSQEFKSLLEHAESAKGVKDLETTTLLLKTFGNGHKSDSIDDEENLKLNDLVRNLISGSKYPLQKYVVNHGVDNLKEKLTLHGLDDNKFIDKTVEGSKVYQNFNKIYIDDLFDDEGIYRFEASAETEPKKKLNNLFSKVVRVELDDAHNALRSQRLPEKIDLLATLRLKSLVQALREDKTEDKPSRRMRIDKKEMRQLGRVMRQGSNGGEFNFNALVAK